VSAADGVVVGTTRIVDHGDPARRFNLVLLAEGFQAAELPAFHTACDAFVDTLFATAPFGELWCALNVYRVDVASTDSGADDPAACGDGTAGSGATPRTFFDATFCFANTRRLLVGDEALALATAQAAVPGVPVQVAVIVNSAQYGGAGGGVAWFSRDPRASEIGIHELGHSAFTLGDEYADVIDRFTGAEPLAQADRPNVTSDTGRATTKWADLILPATPLPTMSNPDATCTTFDARPSTVAAGTVGLFEGAGRARCGLYRAEQSCGMRVLGQPFCAVCRRVIRQVLRPFLPATLAARTGVQFTGTLDAGRTRAWFTHHWPACWQVAWTVAPRSLTVAPPGQPGPDLRCRVRVERASREHVTYWIAVTNLDATPVEFEGRYEILSRE